MVQVKSPFMGVHCHCCSRLDTSLFFIKQSAKHSCGSIQHTCPTLMSSGKRGGLQVEHLNRCYTHIRTLLIKPKSPESSAAGSVVKLKCSTYF